MTETPQARDNQGHLTGYSTRGYRGYILAVLLLVYTLNFIDRNLIGVLSASIIREFGLSDGQYGFLAGWPFAFFYAIMGLPLAMAADRFNRVKLMVFCIILWSVMTAFCGLAAGFWSLLAFRVGVAIGEAGCTPPANSIIADYFKPSSRATAIAIYSMGVTLGGVLAFLFGGILAGMEGETFGKGLSNMGLGFIANQFDWSTISGWRIAFVVIGAPGVLIALLMWLTLKEPPRGYTDPPEMHNTGRAGLMETLREIGPKPTFWWATSGASLVAFVGYGLFTFQTPFLVREHGASLGGLSVPEQVRYFSIYFGAPLAFLSAIGTFMGGFLTDKLSRRSFSAVAWIPAIGLWVSVPFYLLAFYTPDLRMVWIYLAVASICHYAYLGAQYNITQGIVRNRSRATAIAILLILVSLIGNGIGPQFVGTMSDVFASSILRHDTGLTLAVCNAATGLSTEQMAQCAAAKSQGLKQGVSVSVLVFILAGACFMMSCRYIKSDWVANTTRT